MVAAGIALDQAAQEFEDLAGLRRTLDEIDIGPLVAALSRTAPTGRRKLPRKPIVRAHLAAYALAIPNVSKLVYELNNNPALRSVCGFTTRLPNRTTFGRVFQKMAERHYDLLWKCCVDLVAKCAGYYPGFGTEIAIDSTTVVNDQEH